MKTLLLFLVCCSAISFAANKPQAPQAQLGWVEPVSGCSILCTYDVYRGPSSGGETLLASGITPLDYTDSTVVRGSYYCYEVTAINIAGQSAYSNELCGTDPTIPSAPTGLTVQFSKLAFPQIGITEWSQFSY